MNVSISEHLIRIVTVTLTERVDAFTCGDLRKQLEEISDDGVSNLIIDLSGVDFLDSAGMAVLVSTLKRARQKGGDVKLVWPASPDGQRILRLTRFDRVFPMFDTAAAALSAQVA